MKHIAMIALALLVFLIYSPHPWAAEAQTTCTQIDSGIQQTLQYCERLERGAQAIPLEDPLSAVLRGCCDRVRTFLGSTCLCSPVPGFVIPRNFSSLIRVCGVPNPRIWQCDEVCGSVTPPILEEIAMDCRPVQVPGFSISVASQNCCRRLNSLNLTCICTRNSPTPQNLLAGARLCTALPQVGQCRS